MFIQKIKSKEVWKMILRRIDKLANNYDAGNKLKYFAFIKHNVHQQT